MGLIVQKFGGTSVADADCIRRVAGIIRIHIRRETRWWQCCPPRGIPRTI